MKLEVKNMYGLNGKETFLLESEYKHNFIYGINAAGKSSVANAVLNIINKSKYEKRFPYDSDDYLVKVEFDNLISEYNQNTSLETLSDVSKKIFVFNKNFIKNSLSINSVEGQGITPEIGIRVAEKNALIEKNAKITDTLAKKTKKILGNSQIPTTQKELYSNSHFKAVYGKDVNAQKEALISIASLKGDIIDDLTDKDFKNENIELFNLFQQSICELNAEIIDKISEKVKEKNYKIEDKETLVLYEQTIKYLNSKRGKINCPICLSSEIDVEQVKNEIAETLQEIENNIVMKNVKEYYEKLTSIDSLFAGLAADIYEQITKFSYPDELIKGYDEKLQMLIKNYDYNIIKYSKLDIDQKELAEISINEKEISKIEKENERISNSDFILEFDKMLDCIFSDDEIRAQAKLEDKSLTIQLVFKGKEKEGKSIGEFFDIISESQKTKLSLAFFFSLIVYKNYNSNILCVFDDPIDSYDSISKYKISRILYEFIEKKNMFEGYGYNCYSIFLSHSVEYFRLFISNFRKSQRSRNGYYIFSKKLSEISCDDLFMIEGDYNILSRLIHEEKGKNKQIDEFISILPILRELTNSSYKVLNTDTNLLTVDTYKIEDISKYISNNIIHGFDCNVTLNDLLNELQKVIVLNLEQHNFSGNDKIFEIIESIITQNKTIAINGELAFRKEIVLKNIIALYIRAFFDSILAKIIKNHVSKYSGKTLEEIKNDSQLWTINNKISVIYADATTRQNYKDICTKISVDLTMLNDFGHSAGIYMTPLIDVDIKELYNIYDEIKDTNSIYAPIIQLS